MTCGQQGEPLEHFSDQAMQIIVTDAEHKASEAAGDGQTSQVLDPCG